MPEALLTQRDMVILQHAWHCFQSPDALKLDIEKLAKRCNMNNPKSAANAWASIKKKLSSAEGEDDAATANDGDTATPKTTPTKATPKKRAPAKVKAEVPDESEGGNQADTEKTPGATSPSPQKGGRKRKAAEITDPYATAFKAENDIEENDNGEVAATETPQKAKRTYKRKPKIDLNAAIAKRGKKPSKADEKVEADTECAIAAAKAREVVVDDNDPNIYLFGGAPVNENEEEGRPVDADEQPIVNEELGVPIDGDETAV